jgi:hypothetical protein
MDHINKLRVQNLLSIEDASNNNVYTFGVNELTEDRIITLPPLTDDDMFVLESYPQTLANKALINPTISSISNMGTITFPEGTDTLVARNTTDTLKNKTWGDNLDMNNNKIINLSLPTADGDVANKAYVDGVATGLDFKDSVVVATTRDLNLNSSISGNITYSPTTGPSSSGQIFATLLVTDTFVVDDVRFTSSDNGSRVLLKNQSSGSENGIWVITILDTNLTLNRASDFDEDDKVTGGAFVFVEQGSTYADAGFVLTTNDPITIGGISGTSLNFSQFSGAGNIVGGSGLAKTGSVLDVVGSSTIVVNDDNVQVNSSNISNQVLLSSGQVGISANYGSLPLNDSNAVSGTLPVSKGGTGQTTFVSNAVLKGNGVNGLTSSGVTIDSLNSLTTSGGIKVSSPDKYLTVSGPNADLKIGFDTSFGTFVIKQSGTDGTLRLFPNANNPQYLFGSNKMTGSAFIDVKNSKDLRLQTLEGGRIVVGESGIIPATAETVNIGESENTFAKIYASSFYGDGSNLTGITDSSIDGLAGINATKISNGSVTDEKFQFLSSVTSDIQDQLDERVPFSETNLFHIENGSSGNSNHIKFQITKSVTDDNYNIGVDVDDPCKVICSSEDGMLRQATVFASSNNNLSTIFGVSRSVDSGDTWQPIIVARQDQKVGIGKKYPSQALDVNGNIAVSGTVDGRNISVDGTTLDNHIGASSNIHGVNSFIVGTSDAQTLSNKSLNDTNTYFQNTADTSKKFKFDISGISTSTTRILTVPNANFTMVGTTLSQALTNKTIDSVFNTISNIDNANIKQLAGIDASKIANGSVSNTEFQYINSLTGNVQEQLNYKASSIHMHSANDITSGVLSVIRGGTGSNTFTQNSLLIGNGINGIVSMKCKWDGTLAPTANNDLSEGYIVGSRWLDILNDKEYVCVDNTNTLAIWIETTVDPGEVNTGSNIGSSGVGIFKQKNGVNFEFKKLNVLSNKITVVDDADNNKLDIDVISDNIAINDLSGAPDGEVVGISDFQTLTNKSFQDSSTFFIDNLDTTKRLQFQLENISTATTRTLTVPDANTTVVGTNIPQTLTNKTINTANNSISIYTTDIVSGTFADARIASSNVTQHQGLIDHGSIAGLSDDDHPQYLKLAGRSGGQTVKGGINGSDNLRFESTTHSTKGRIIFEDPITVNDEGYATSSILSIQRDSDYSYLEILNNGGSNKGCFFGMEFDQFALYNWQGGDIKFYVDTVASSGDNKFTMENSGVFRIHNLKAGVIKSDVDGRLSYETVNTAFNKNFGNTSGTVTEGSHVVTSSGIHGVTGDVVGTSDSQILTNKRLGDSLDMNYNKIINVSTPTLDSDVATKGYVDSAVTGIGVKDSVVLATTRDLSLNASILGSITYNSTGGVSGRGQIVATLVTTNMFIVDGVTITSSEDGSRILLKDQTVASQNGIWTTTVSGSHLTLDRSIDFDEDNDVATNSFVFVEEGDINADIGYVLTTDNPITVGGSSGTPLTFTQFSRAGDIVAGNGLTKSGNSLNIGGSSTIIANAENLEVNSSNFASQVLLSSGSDGLASFFGALPLNNSNSVSGILSVSNGGIGSSSLTSGGILRGNGSGAINSIKSNWNSSVAPTVDNDASEGYEVGSRWLDTTNMNEYICFDASKSSAIWKQTSNGDNGKVTFVIETTQTTATSTSYETFCYFIWNNTYYSTFTNGVLMFEVFINDRNLDLKVRDATNAVDLGEINDISADGFYTLAISNPISDSRLEVQIKKSASGGTSPKIIGATLQYQQESGYLNSNSFNDATTFFVDNLDNSKKFQFQLANIGTSTTRIWTIPNESSTFVGTNTTQTLTNKTVKLGGDLSLNNNGISYSIPSLNGEFCGETVLAAVDVNTIGLGSALFMKTDGKFDEADASSNSTKPCRVLAIESGTGLKKLLLKGFLKNNSWGWITGKDIFLSTINGYLTQTAPSGSGELVQKVGYAWNSTTIYFSPGDYSFIKLN